MALSMSMTLTDNFNQQINFDSVYIKVESVKATKHQATAVVEFWSAPDETPLMSQNKVFEPDMDGPNPIKQAYEYLKTLPEFADAVDC